MWTAGVAAVVALGRSPRWPLYDPAGLTAPFGSLGNALVAPGARWDATWYLAITLDGYVEPSRTAFFPLYPLLVRIAGLPGAAVGDDRIAYLLAGIAVSLAAFAAALYVVRRLAELDLGEPAARATTWLVALFPTAFAFSAIYTESVFLALSAGSFYAGRLGRWRWAGVAGLLAAATRSTGVLLVVPLAILWWRGAPRAPATSPGCARSGRLRRLPGPWGSPTEVRGRRSALRTPGIATWQCLGRRLTAHGRIGRAPPLASARVTTSTSLADGDPYVVAARDLGGLAFLGFTVVALISVFRRLPLAYGASALLAVAAPLSSPVGPEPLASFPRYLAVVYPSRCRSARGRRRRVERPAAVVSGLLMVGLTVPFAVWEWVA